MENRKEGNWMSVPTFGDWDMKNGAMPDYSMDFTKIREMRKQNKKEISRASLGNEEELATNSRQQQQQQQQQQGGGARRGHEGNLHHRHVDSHGSDEMDHRRPLHHARDQSPTGRKKILSYFQCCVGASA
ncbi:sorbin/SH3 domain protein [Rhynchospora pubera]|uniref:Sorbin/SH3 domain protein n=1 Tax=Rhynchospora pubera TaxID=906938 RepID=A0AAV8C507_9POAL|nr:sorbin/SH3 domain protein [Rhynchospora pubera]